MQDSWDLARAHVYNSPGDVASWPATVRIARLEIHRSHTLGEGVGVTVDPPLPDTWLTRATPQMGPLKFTFWPVVAINGELHTSGIVQRWADGQTSGAAILDGDWANWCYDGRWGPMTTYQPKVGDPVGFFITAGGARGQQTPTSVRERSDVVIVRLPANNEGVFTFDGQAPTPAPPIAPPPGPIALGAQVLAQLAGINERLDTLIKVASGGR